MLDLAFRIPEHQFVMVMPCASEKIDQRIRAAAPSNVRIVPTHALRGD